MENTANENFFLFLSSRTANGNLFISESNEQPVKTCFISEWGNTANKNLAYPITTHHVQFIHLPTQYCVEFRAKPDGQVQ
jgi:hypothetical protein